MQAIKAGGHGGSIPARGEGTTRNRDNLRTRQKHPRTRGRNMWPTRAVTAPAEASPHAGKELFKAVFLAAWDRSIPARGEGTLCC